MKEKVIPTRCALIFGGAGFIGSNWAYRLLNTSDAHVHIFDNLSRPGVEINLKSLQQHPEAAERLEITVGDIRNRAAVERAVRRATEIYHFAAQVAVTTSIADPRLDFDINVGGTFNILEAARLTGRRPFMLFTSTNKVYGSMPQRTLISGGRRYVTDPRYATSEAQPVDFHSPYGCSKGSAEQYVRDYARIFNLPTVVFRMSCIAGPRQFGNEDQGWVAHFLYSALGQRPVTIYGDGRQVRDVLGVEDLMRAIEGVRTSLVKTAGQIYNVGGGVKNSISLLELIATIGALTGHGLICNFAPPRAGDQPIYMTDFAKLRGHIDWEPTLGVGQILKNILSWWNQNQEQFQFAARATCPPLGMALVHAPGAAS